MFDLIKKRCCILKESSDIAAAAACMAETHSYSMRANHWYHSWRQNVAAAVAGGAAPAASSTLPTQKKIMDFVSQLYV